MDIGASEGGPPCGIGALTGRDARAGGGGLVGLSGSVEAAGHPAGSHLGPRLWHPDLGLPSLQSRGRPVFVV